MGLSSDPEKRERQLAGLRKGQDALAAKRGFVKPEAKAETAPPAKAKAKASQGSQKPPAKAKAKARQGSDVIDYDQHKEQRARTPKARRPAESRDRPRRGGGFLDGLLGR